MGSNPTIPTEERKYESPGSETHRLPCGGKVVGPFHSPLRRSLISRRAFQCALRVLVRYHWTTRVWRSLVACLHGVQEVVGSNPTTLTR